ncbi:MAG: hypothetical protein PHR82_04480 [Endomicrobiaceae bacterium]|nr:hypothetical protein [Endomicrobiaceae bacterium]
MKIEKALFINNIKDLQSSLSYDRLYYGHEFCEYLLPSEDELKRVLDFVIKNNLPFTFVTPTIGNDKINLLEKLIGITIEKADLLNKFEMVVNDFGVLSLIRQKNISNPVIAAGRLMTKQKRDPRIKYISSLSESAKKYYMSFSLDSLSNLDFIRDFNIKRFELDNVLQGISRQSKITSSLYVPYCYISTTKLCYMAQTDKEERYLRKKCKCSAECINYDVYMKNDKMKRDLYLKGNTIFYANDVLPENMNNSFIDRIVNNEKLFK